MGKLYALLIGIDSYPEGTRSLEGCVNDVADVEDYLAQHYSDLALLKLTNADATYANVIAQIRAHLGQAGQDDVAYLHYSGHGARSAAAPEFLRFDQDKRDEGLVCHDSRLDGNYDLADKELAWLISDLAKNEPHIAWLFDCCHSGTGTRDLDGANKAGVRGVGEGNFPRAIESYLEGQYAGQRSGDAPIVIPQSRHILMAACDKDETAKEDLIHSRGIFTKSLYDVLRETRGDLSYAELFGRARVRVGEYVRTVNSGTQRPQFEAIAGFDGWQGFLGRARVIGRKSYSVGKVGDVWSADCGALAGLPLSPATPVMLALAAENNPDLVLGSAKVTRVGATSSDVVPDFAADPAARYLATVTSLPEPPLRVFFKGEDALRAEIVQVLSADPMLTAELAGPDSPDDGYVLTVEDGRLVLFRTDDEATAATFPLDDKAKRDPALLSALAHVAQWRRLLALSNPGTQLDPSKVSLSYAQKLPDGSERIHEPPALTLAVERKGDGTWDGASGELRLRNHTARPLYYVMLHFGDDYSISVNSADQVAPGGEPTVLLQTQRNGTATPSASFWLNDGEVAVEQFKLILTTEPSDAFRFTLDKLASDRGFGSEEEMLAATKAIDDEWFTIPLTVRVTPALAAVGPAAASLADGQIKVAAHDGVTATLAVVQTLGDARGLAAEDQFTGALAAAGIYPAPLAGGRGSAAAALDITDISDPAKLAEAPLRVTLDLKPAANEVVIPLVRDGPYLLPAGDFWTDETGATQVELRQVPTPLADQRGLGASLRMYFFKAVLEFDRVNQLRLVSFDPAGKAVYSGEGKVAAVKAAKRILLAVHGLLGDTREMLEGLHAAGQTASFDLVLAYDYENLKTPLDQTARALKEDLAAVGINAADGKHLTVASYAMGGLVARWLIEKEDGGAIVDHLVMCGTPNAGSPFGEVSKARKVLLALMGIGSAFAWPVCATIASVLSASAKLTGTLEQLAPDSDFIRALNTATPTATRYTILAGNIADYQAEDPAFFAGLLDKLSRSATLDLLLGSTAHDVAATVSSIRLDDVPGDHPAVRTTVACHHLNYFTSPAGRAALAAVEWGT